MHAKYLLCISGMALAVLMAVPREAIGACSFNSTVGVSFGAYRFFDATPTDSTGSITYTCLLQFSPITIDLSKGSAPTYVPRQMRKGTDTLNYNLYLDASRVSIWGTVPADRRAMARYRRRSSRPLPSRSTVAYPPARMSGSAPTRTRGRLRLIFKASSNEPPHCPVSGSAMSAPALPGLLVV